MAQIELKGDIIPNDIQWIYDWLEWDATSPAVIQKAINGMQPGEELEVVVNSPGGDVMSGQQMYSLFRSVKSRAKIQSFAASAAGVAAMGCAVVEISPAAMLMIHNVWCSGVSGDFHDMDRASEMLKQMNAAMSAAFVEKTGRSLEEILEIMDRETWITARQAVEYGFADKITEATPVQFTNGMTGLRLTEEIKQRVMAEKARSVQENDVKNKILRDLDFYGV